MLLSLICFENFFLLYVFISNNNVVNYNLILLCRSTRFKLIAPSNKRSILSNRNSTDNSHKDFRIYTSFFCLFSI